MKLGMALPQMGPYVTREAVAGFARRADELGYDTLWAQDHLFYPLKPIDDLGLPGGLWPATYRQLMAPLQILPFVAAITDRIDIGTSILVSGYYRPLQLAKMAATIDVLSGGRFILGLGLGWSKEEYALMETPFEKRGARADDFIEALIACLGENPVEHDGPFYSIPISETSPKPLGTGADGKPRMRLLGGYWSEAGMRRIAKYCDYWVAAPHTLEEAVAAGRKINTIARDEYGRGPVKTIMRINVCPALPGVINPERAPLGMPMNYWYGTAEAMVPLMEEVKAFGIDEVTLDVNYFEGLPGPASWSIQPDFFKPLLDVAHR